MSRNVARRPVLMISQVPPPYHGSTVMSQRLFDMLADLNQSPVLVDRRFSQNVEDVGRFSIAKLLAVPSLLWRLGQAIFRYRPGLSILFLTNRPGSFLIDFAMTGLLRATRTPIILYLHTGGYKTLSLRGRPWRWLLSATFRRADTVVTLSPRLVDDISDWTKPAQVEVIPNYTPPIDESESVNAVRDSDSIHILFLGNLIPEKGAHEVAAVTRLLALEEFNVRVTICGAPTEDAYYQRLLEEASLLENLAVIPGLYGDEKNELILSSDLLLYPSRYPLEAQPLVILECLSAGVPVVSYDVGGIADILAFGGGILIEDNAGDGTTRLAAAITALVSSPGTLDRMAAAARETYERHYSYAAFRDRWKSILASPRRS